MASPRSHAASERPPAPWIVRHHGELEALDDGLWTVDGTITLPLGAFPRRMTVVRLDDGRLLIHSAISLDEAGMASLLELGDPAILVVPNDHHRADALAWKQRMPELTVVAPAGSRERIEAEVPVDSTALHIPDVGVQLHTVRGTRDHELALIVRRAAGTSLVVTDLIANMRATQGFKGWMLKLMGFAGDQPHVPAPVRALLVKEKDALREQLLEWAAFSDLRRIVVAHGEVIAADPQGVLRALSEAL